MHSHFLIPCNPGDLQTYLSEDEKVKQNHPKIIENEHEAHLKWLPVLHPLWTQPHEKEIKSAYA